MLMRGRGQWLAVWLSWYRSAWYVKAQAQLSYDRLKVSKPRSLRHSRRVVVYISGVSASGVRSGVHS